MKHFPLNLNEGLADILRSATELNELIRLYSKKNMTDFDLYDWQEFPAKQIEEMQKNTTDMISTLGEIIGYDISTQAFKEIKDTLINKKDI